MPIVNLPRKTSITGFAGSANHTLRSHGVGFRPTSRRKVLRTHRVRSGVPEKRTSPPLVPHLVSHAVRRTCVNTGTIHTVQRFIPYDRKKLGRRPGTVTTLQPHATTARRLRRWVFWIWIALTIAVAAYVGIVAPFTPVLDTNKALIALIVPPTKILLLGIGFAWLIFYVLFPPRGNSRQSSDIAPGTQG
jgi:hypothetical protein